MTMNDNQNIFIDALNRMVAEGEKLPLSTESVAGCALAGGPNSTLATLGLVQQVLGRLTVVQGLLGQHLAAQQQAESSRGRPKGSRDKPKIDTMPAQAKAESVANDENSPPRDPKKVHMPKTKICLINRYRPAEGCGNA